MLGFLFTDPFVSAVILPTPSLSEPSLLIVLEYLVLILCINYTSSSLLLDFQQQMTLCSMLRNRECIVGIQCTDSVYLHVR